MPPRFFVDAPLAAGAAIHLPAGVAHHATRVLRLRNDAPVTLFNGRGGEYHARLRIEGSTVSAEIESHAPVERESPLAVRLIQALVAADKLDWIVEKAVELGAERIAITPTRRSVLRLDGERAARRQQHLTEIVRSACAQCGRNRVPVVRVHASLAAALADEPAEALRLLLDPHSGDPLPAPEPRRRVVLLVGPEGGFGDDEVEQAVAAGFTRARLGPRILRTETAGPTALAALQALAGDFAPGRR